MDDDSSYLISDVRIDLAKCLMCQNTQFSDAQALISRMLDDNLLTSQDDERKWKAYHSAQTVFADILYEMGQRKSAYEKRVQIAKSYRQNDPRMRSLDVLRAWERVAHSLIDVNPTESKYTKSLELREKVESKIKLLVPPNHELMFQTKENLARFKMKFASEHAHKKSRREYTPRGKELMISAVKLAQQAWMDAARNWGLTWPRTLGSLAVMIACERVVQSFDNVSEIKYKGQSAMDETAIQISDSLDQITDHITSVWYWVQFEDCLEFDFNVRMTKLQALDGKICAATSASLVERRNGMKLEVEFHIAMIKMESLLWEHDRQKKTAKRREQQFTDAAEALDDVWRRSGKGDTPGSMKNPASVRFLASTVEAYKATRDQRYWPRARDLCMLLGSMYGEEGSKADEALNSMARTRNERRPKDSNLRSPKLSYARLEEMDTVDFSAWIEHV